MEGWHIFVQAFGCIWVSHDMEQTLLVRSYSNPGCPVDVSLQLIREKREQKKLSWPDFTLASGPGRHLILMTSLLPFPHRIVAQNSLEACPLNTIHVPNNKPVVKGFFEYLCCYSSHPISITSTSMNLTSSQRAVGSRSFF